MKLEFSFTEEHGCVSASAWIRIIFWQCSGSGMFIPDPDFHPSLIFTHPGSRIQKQQQKRGVKHFFVIPFYVAPKFPEIKNYFSFEVLKKKIWANFQRIIELFTQKIVTKLSKIWVWDPRSGIRKNLFRIPDPGVKKAPDPGSGSATLFFGVLRILNQNLGVVD